MGRRLGVIVAACALVISAGAGGCGGDDGGSGERSTQAGGRARPDGSLGDANTSTACTLLAPAQIEAQFGGPVGPATPIFPYCQWTVGADAFVAVRVIPQPIGEYRQFEQVSTSVAGPGEGAFMGTNRYLYFGVGDTTYSVQWQKVGDFSTVESARLQALGQDVVAALEAP